MNRRDVDYIWILIERGVIRGVRKGVNLSDDFEFPRSYFSSSLISAFLFLITKCHQRLKMSAFIQNDYLIP